MPTSRAKHHGLCVCIVGAGGSYTPELVEGLLAQSEQELPVCDIRMHDIDARRLEIMAGLAERMLRASGRSVRLRHGTELAPLLDGADFVVTQVRVGGMAARYLDESIPMKYGIVGQETTGAGGMFKALRTIPVMLEVARTVERVAPQAFILNYTNPSGIVTEAVCRHSGARLIGLCSGIPGMQDKIRELLQPEFGEVRSYCVGLNHLGFIHRLFDGTGADVSARAVARLAELAASQEDHLGLPPPDLIRHFGAVPITYLNYYVHRKTSLAHAVDGGKTRAQKIMDIERRTFEQAADPACACKPEALASRGGGGYANVTFSFMKAIVHNRGAELACTVLNRGTVADLDPDVGVEVVCRVGRNGPKPLKVGQVPLPFRGLVQAVKAYETLTVNAAMSRSRHLLLQALVNHPLVGDLDIIEPLVDEMLKAHNLDYR